MENIESSISELGVIFRQLATLVSEQGEMITRIDSNVESTSINIETAHHELLKYFNNISKNRWLIIKVFGVLMAFFVFFRHIYGIKQEHITFYISSQPLSIHYYISTIFIVGLLMTRDLSLNQHVLYIMHK